MIKNYFFKHSIFFSQNKTATRDFFTHKETCIHPDVHTRLEQRHGNNSIIRVQWREYESPKMQRNDETAACLLLRYGSLHACRVWACVCCCPFARKSAAVVLSFCWFDSSSRVYFSRWKTRQVSRNEESLRELTVLKESEAHQSLSRMPPPPTAITV